MKMWDRMVPRSHGALGEATTNPLVRKPLRLQKQGLYLAFTGLGMTGAVIPAAVPGLAERLSVEPASLLPAVSALFAGLFVGVALTPLAAHRIGASRGAAIGASLQGASLLSLALVETTTGVISAALVSGVGFGVVEASGAVLSRQVHGSTSRTLTGLTATTAAAAALTPLVVVAAGSRVHYVLAAVAVPHVLAVVTLNQPGKAPRSVTSGAAFDAPASASVKWSAAVFCYVGCETVVAGWSSVLPQAAFQLSSPQAAVGTSAFWALLMLGRITALLALKRGARPLAVLAAGQLSAALILSSAALLAKQQPQLAIVFIGLAVCCMGPCYALLLGAALENAAEQDAARVARRLVAVGALGGAVWAGAVASAASVGAATVATAAATGMAASLLLGRSRARRGANLSTGKNRRVSETGKKWTSIDGDNRHVARQ